MVMFTEILNGLGRFFEYSREATSHPCALSLTRAPVLGFQNCRRFPGKSWIMILRFLELEHNPVLTMILFSLSIIHTTKQHLAHCTKQEQKPLPENHNVFNSEQLSWN
jgi:hypothetical protein